MIVKKDKIIIDNTEIFCFYKTLTSNDPAYGILNGLTDLEEYLPPVGYLKEFGKKINFVDINDRQTFRFNIYKPHDIQIRVGEDNPREYLEKYIKIPGLSDLKHIVEPKFDKYVKGDIVKIYVIRKSHTIFAKYLKKNNVGDVKMEIDTDKMIEHYIRNNNIDIKYVDKGKLIKSFNDVIKNAKEESDLKMAIDKSKKDEMDNILKEAKKSVEKISMEEYVKMFHERLRQGLIMYNKIDMEFFFSSMLSGQWVNLRGINGIGKDLLLILFATLSCEDFEEQVLFIPPSLGQDIDDTRTLGYQSSITDKYYHSRTTKHIIKANKNPGKLYIIINSEANVINMDRAYLPISVAIDSANKKITLPRYRKEGDTSIDTDPKITNNILIFNTTNDIARRPELSLKDIDRMNIMNLIHPVLRKTEDRKKLINTDGTNNYKPIIGPDPLFVELCRRHILKSKHRITNVRDLYWADDEYRKFEDDYQDDLINEIDKLNHILKNGHLIYAQMAPRFTDGALKFLYVAIKILKIDPKLAKSQLMLERFIPRIEDITEQHIDTIDIIKDELVEWLSDKDADPIKEIDEIIWKLDPSHKSKKK